MTHVQLFLHAGQHRVIFLQFVDFLHEELLCVLQVMSSVIGHKEYLFKVQQIQNVKMLQLEMHWDVSELHHF